MLGGDGGGCGMAWGDDGDGGGAGMVSKAMFFVVQHERQEVGAAAATATAAAADARKNGRFPVGG